MAVVTASGSQAATLDTEHTLVTTTTAGTYQLVLDLLNAVKGDIFVVRHKVKVLTGSTAAGVAGWEVTVAHDLEASPVVYLPPLVSMHSLAVSIEQTDWTGRTVDWSLVQLDG